MTTYKDDRPGGPLIQEGDIVLPPLLCKGCREPLSVDMERVLQEPSYQAACLACGRVHAFARQSGVILYGFPMP